MKDLKDCKVLVTPRSFGASDPALIDRINKLFGSVVTNPYGRILTADELVPLVNDVDGIIAGLDDYSARVIQGAPNLKVISRYGVGYDKVDVEAARKNSVIVTNTPGANSSSVAELTVALIVLLLRRVIIGVQAIQSGGFPKVSGTSLSKKTVGLLGFGAIAREVAKRLSGFGCNIIAYDPYIDQTIADEYSVGLKEFSQVLEQADVLSLHLPVTDETRLMVNHDFLGQVKKGAYLINTARGELIDEYAVLDALQTGILSGAAIDVYKSEPPGDEFPLSGLDNVICTPHMAAHTDDAINQMGWDALNACVEVLTGTLPKNRIV